MPRNGYIFRFAERVLQTGRTGVA